MADKKISALTGASTPLAGTEVLPIVQSGSTVKVSVANLTVGRAVATAGGSFTDNITQSTAAKGVNFTANTPAAGMTSQLLNWYEEGTWTPADASGGSLTFTGTGGNCYYTRTGNLVTCVFSVTYPTTLDTNSARISGLPFTSKSSTNAIAGGQLSFTNYGSFLSILIDTGGTAFYFWNSSGSLVTNATCSGKTFRAVIQYMV